MTLVEIVTAAIAVLSLLLNCGIALVGATWGIGKIRLTVAKEMEAHRESFDDKVDKVERNFGDSLAAIRQKVHEVEMWARDHLESKGESDRAIARYVQLVGDNFDKIDRRLERMESKIDKVSACAKI